MSTIAISAPIARPTSTVRLTRRGRLVVFAASLLVILAVGVFWGTGSVASGERGEAERTLVVQVQPGDTLYDLAARVTRTLAAAPEDGDGPGSGATARSSLEEALDAAAALSRALDAITELQPLIPPE